MAADRPGKKLQGIVDALRADGLDVHAMESLKTAPRGYPKDHARRELLRQKGLVASRAWPPAGWLRTAGAKARVVDVLRASAPLVGWLEANVGPSGDG